MGRVEAVSFSHTGWWGSVTGVCPMDCVGLFLTGCRLFSVWCLLGIHCSSGFRGLSSMCDRSVSSLLSFVAGAVKFSLHRQVVVRTCGSAACSGISIRLLLSVCEYGQRESGGQIAYFLVPALCFPVNALLMNSTLPQPSALLLEGTVQVSFRDRWWSPLVNAFLTASCGWISVQKNLVLLCWWSFDVIWHTLLRV